jgi:hypothetical protein
VGGVSSGIALPTLPPGPVAPHRDPGWLRAARRARLLSWLSLAKRRLGRRLGSGATAGEGTQNLLCAAQGAAVLAGLAANAAFGAWWLDGTIALVLAAVAVSEGRNAWAGEGCCAVQAPGARRPRRALHGRLLPHRHLIRGR